MRPTIFLLALAAFASAASIRVTDAVLPRIAADFDVGIARASAAVTGFTLAYGLMQVFFGPLGDRFGKLRVVGLGCGVGAIASLGCLALPGFEGLVAARVIAGAACASIIPLSIAWIGDVVPYAERQPVIARFLIGQISGMACGVAAGGFAAEHEAWRWPFAVLTLWFAIVSVLLVRASRHDPAGKADDSHIARDAAEVFATPWARVVVLTVFAEGLVLLGVFAFIPTHLHYVRGIELSTAGLAVVAYALGGVVFAIFARPIVTALGEVKLAVAGTLFMAAGCVIVALAPSAMGAAAGCLAAGIGFYGFHNTLQTNATQMAPRRRGAAMALFASFLFLGQSVGVAVAGALVERYGTTAVMLAAGAAIVPVGITFARLRMRQ